MWYREYDSTSPYMYMGSLILTSSLTLVRLSLVKLNFRLVHRTIDSVGAKLIIRGRSLCFTSVWLYESVDGSNSKLETATWFLGGPP